MAAHVTLTHNVSVQIRTGLFLFGNEAHEVERVAVNHTVVGSSPTIPVFGPVDQ